MNATIVEAINNRRLLSFNYDGYSRTVEPHAYGVSTAGKMRLRAFQVAGGHKDSHGPGWHLFSLEKMRSISIEADSFSGPRQGYNRNDNAMERILAQL